MQMWPVSKCISLSSCCYLEVASDLTDKLSEVASDPCPLKSSSSSATTGSLAPLEVAGTAELDSPAAEPPPRDRLRPEDEDEDVETISTSTALFPFSTFCSKSAVAVGALFIYTLYAVSCCY